MAMHMAKSIINYTSKNSYRQTANTYHSTGCTVNTRVIFSHVWASGDAPGAQTQTEKQAEIVRRQP